MPLFGQGPLSFLCCKCTTCGELCEIVGTVTLEVDGLYGFSLPTGPGQEYEVSGSRTYDNVSLGTILDDCLGGCSSGISVPPLPLIRAVRRTVPFFPPLTRHWYLGGGANCQPSIPGWVNPTIGSTGSFVASKKKGPSLPGLGLSGPQYTLVRTQQDDLPPTPADCCDLPEFCLEERLMVVDQPPGPRSYYGEIVSRICFANLSVGTCPPSTPGPIPDDGKEKGGGGKGHKNRQGGSGGVPLFD